MPSFPKPSFTFRYKLRMPDTDARVAIVNEHMRLENLHDFAGCIAMFGRPRYEVVAGDEIYDGGGWGGALPRGEPPRLPRLPVRADPGRAPTPDAVVVEGRFQGTHEGSWRGLPATGKKVDFPMCLIFEFEGEVMTNERLYFDIGTPLLQLGAADDPNSLKFMVTTMLLHPWTITKAVVRTIWLRLTPRK